MFQLRAILRVTALLSSLVGLASWVALLYNPGPPTVQVAITLVFAASLLGLGLIWVWGVSDGGAHDLPDVNDPVGAQRGGPPGPPPPTR